MKVYEYAKENDMTVKEVKELFNLPSHMSLIPKSCNELPEVVVEIASKQELPVEAITEIVKDAVEDVKEVLDDADVDLELIANSIKGAGTKSPFYHLKHLIGR